MSQAHPPPPDPMAASTAGAPAEEPAETSASASRERTATESPTGARRVVFFDGVCNLCNSAVDFLVRIDAHARLRFASLQGETAAAEPGIGDQLEEAAAEEWSLVYLRGEGDHREILTRSNAVLAILSDLGGLWRVLSWARVVPRPLRDAVYRTVARYRYRWFGRRDTCRLPTPEERERFLP